MPGSTIAAVIIVLVVAVIVTSWMRSERLQDMQAKIRRLRDDLDEIWSRRGGGPR